MTNYKLLCAAVILVSVFCKCFAIRCYYCSSANNSACLNVKDYKDEVRAQLIPIVDCNAAIPAALNTQFFCRKIVQTIYHPNRDSDLRITRGCGWVPHEKPCYRADNSDHKETVCQCTADLCNGGHTVSPGGATILFLVLAFSLNFVR